MCLILNHRRKNVVSGFRTSRASGSYREQLWRHYPSQLSFETIAKCRSPPNYKGDYICQQGKLICTRRHDPYSGSRYRACDTSFMEILGCQKLRQDKLLASPDYYRPRPFWAVI